LRRFGLGCLTSTSEKEWIELVDWREAGSPGLNDGECGITGRIVELQETDSFQPRTANFVEAYGYLRFGGIGDVTIGTHAAGSVSRMRARRDALHMSAVAAASVILVWVKWYQVA
jgi:hypothetical protein